MECRILRMKPEDIGLWASSFLGIKGTFRVHALYMHYTFYTRTTQNGDILMDIYVDLCENSCKMVF